MASAMPAVARNAPIPVVGHRCAIAAWLTTIDVADLACSAFAASGCGLLLRASRICRIRRVILFGSAQGRPSSCGLRLQL
jgi:hypothetical protein